MNELQITTGDAGGQDLQDLVIETFEVEELSDLDVNAPLSLSLCSSTCSSSCG